MKRYPKFLRAMPEFLGLGFIDLGVVIVALNLGLLFGFESIVTIVLVICFLGLYRLLRWKFDLVALNLKCTKTLDISEMTGRSE